LHLGNLCCTLPGLNEHIEEDLIEHFGPPECTVVLTADPMDQTTSFPPYLVTSISIVDYMVNAKPPLPSIEVEPSSLKILDFGSGVPSLILFSLRIHHIKPAITASHKDQQRPRMQCAVAVCPPEVAFSIVALGNNDPDWDVQSDIWSLGCTVGLPNFI
jgi:serine/threonine-protein kinase SRPK3